MICSIRQSRTVEQKESRKKKSKFISSRTRSSAVKGKRSSGVEEEESAFWLTLMMIIDRWSISWPTCGLCALAGTGHTAPQPHISDSIHRRHRSPPPLLFPSLSLSFSFFSSRRRLLSFSASQTGDFGNWMNYSGSRSNVVACYFYLKWKSSFF